MLQVRRQQSIYSKEYHIQHKEMLVLCRSQMNFKIVRVHI